MVFYKHSVQFSCSVMSNSLWPHGLSQTSLSITNSWSLLKLMSIKSMMPSNHIILSSPSPPTFNLSKHQGLFQWVSSLHQMAKVMEIQFQLSPSNEYSGLISFGSVASPRKPRDSKQSSPTPEFKASILQHSAFFIVQISHSYMTIWKTIALTRQTFINKFCLCLLCCLGWS